jgi:hypothetical protein
VRLTHAKRLAARIDAVPPTQSGRFERPKDTNTHNAQHTITVPARRNNTPKIVNVVDSSAHSRRTINAATTGKNPYSIGIPRHATKRLGPVLLGSPK